MESRQRSASVEQSLDHLWHQFVSSQNHREKLSEYLQSFIQSYSALLDVDFSCLETQRSAVNFHREVLIPDELLPTLKYRVLAYVEEKLNDELQIQDVNLLLQVLIILSRNSKTMELVASSDFIKPVLVIFEAVLNKTWSSEISSRQQLLSFTRFALLYLECLYDPNFNWRLSLQKLPQKKKTTDDSCSAVGLDLHIVPFIYECLHRSHIDAGIQLQLLHLYGAIISGSRANSVTAICPATVDILMRVLQGLSSRSSSDVTHMTSVILKCVVATVHAVHCAIPEERQVEVGAILEMYYQVLLQLCDNDRNISLQLAMLDAIEAMFSTVDKSSMQNAFMASGICRHLLIFIRSIKKWPSYSHMLSTAAVRVFGVVLSDSTTAKEKFIQTVGYENVFEALKDLGQPTRDLLTSLLEMVCEKRLDEGSRLSVRNSRVVILLIKWLPDIDSELQSWLSSTLYHICTANTWSLNQCCNDGINAAILDCLLIWNELDTKTVGDLLDLIEATGSQFIWQNDLKKLLQLFKSDSGKHLELWMEKRLLKAMSKMAESDNKQIPATYFQFNSCDHGIKATNLGRWSGSGFSFHAWICLENPPSFPDDFRMARRQLYMIQTSSGSGFEAFFTHEAVLVISVFSKKERNDIPVMDCPIVCNKWYCIDVVHASSKRPFGQSQLCVYVDEVLHVSANLKFPALGDEVVVCKIGCGSGEVGSPWIRVKSNGIQAASDVTAHESKSLPSVGDFASKSSSSSSSSGFWSRLSFRPGSRAARLPSDSNDGDGGDVRHGLVVSLFGCLSEVVVFTEALLDTQVQSLFRLGPNRYLNQLKDGAVPPELPAKPLFAYHAKASFRETCYDLSGNGHHAKVAGHLCTASNIRDVIHTIGGVQLLYFLLEEAAVLSSGFSEVDLINFSKENRRSRSAIDSLEPFFLLLRSLVQNCPMNQDALLHNDGIAALGAILQKASSSLLDNKFHESLKAFVKSLPSSPDDAKLLHEVYQHLIFDFRIWSNCSLHVCLGHIQYLQLIIKEDRKYFRKKYGVQYVLDAVRMCFGSTSSGHLTAEQKEEIRTELMKIILFYVSREINAAELSQILAFISAVQDEVLISEVLGIIKSLLVERGKRDQIYLLLFEPGMADMLYVLLTVKDYSVELKEKIFQIVALLLKTDRVYERNKSRLRLVDSNLFPGLVSLMVETQPSVQMTKHMLEQVFIAESSASINAAIYIIQTLYLCDVDVKLEAVRQLMKVLLSKPTIPKLFAKQIGWQIALIRLFIRRPSPTSASKWRSSFDEAETRPVVQRAESVSDDPPERLIEIPRDDDTTADFQNEEDDVPNKFLMSSEFDPYAVPDGRTVRRSSISSCPDATDDGSLSSLRGPSRSPSTFSSLSLGCENQVKTLVKDGCEGKAVMMALKELGLNGLPNTENMERTEELCLNLLIVLFLIIWKGFDQADETAWQERGEVFAAIAYTSEDNELLISKTELTQKLLELLLQGCLIDVQDSGVSNPNNAKNSVNVMKLLYKFLCLDDGAGTLKFSKQLLEDLMILLEDFSVWQTGNEWKEMEQMALRCLLAFAAQENSDLCGIASARLHAMIRDRPVEKFQESCFLVGVINDILIKSQDGTGDQYGFLIQVMKSLLEKCEDLLNIPSYLPSLPIIRSSRSFIEAFKTYSRSEEWTAFIKRQVEPSKDQYLVNIYEGLRIQLTAYMGECHEEMMVAGHKRNREKGEAKLKFEEEFVATFKNSARQENKRFKSMRLQLRNRTMAAWNQWTLTRSFFLSERGLWPDKNLHSMHWKLSLYENYSRMRPKLIPNEKFDQHLEASRLRDNEACEEELSSAVSTLSLITEVKAKGSAGDDRLEDDEWNLISGNASTNEHLSTKETILTEECELVTIMEVIKGRLDVTATHIYFFDCTPLREDGGIVDLKWSLDEIKEIHFRRHNLRRSALEFFLVDQTNYFINFQKKVRNKVYSRILSLRPPNLIYNQSRSPAELLKSSGLTQKWIQREIDNFDYLMCLNTIAGRTYNDLSQYPVFPWVLSDYKSETLDLNNPQSYRDLSRPIGVVNPKNEIQVQEKYEHFEDPTGTVAKFHYGTHYSNPAGVMHYLIRMEPFTTLHIQLQSGRFDVADRQFHSIPAMWEGLMDNPNDVKELIPEFFYLPEFLINMNDFDLGKLQFGDGKVDDVILPPWASTPYEFIHKHRLALESDYVSDHLHEWIDLIFGYKQQGTAAAEALNVFYYCTYEGAVDLESVTDEKKRRAFEGMINNFGQTPCQLLKEPHPKRMSLQEIVARTTKPERPLKVFIFAEKLNTFSVEAAPQNDHLAFVAIPRSQTTSFISHWTTESLIAITESGAVYTHGWLPYDKNIPGFFTFERDPSINNAKTRKRLPGPMMPGLNVTSKMFALSHDAKLLFSCGHWDNSLRVYSVARNKQLAHIVRHRDIVTCVSLDHSSRHLISGSRDTTCMIWEIVHQGSSSCNINPRPVHVLYGHNDQITCVAIATELDMAVSGSEDGTVIVHTVKDGMYLRTLRPPYEKGWQLSIRLLALSDVGQICVYCQHSPRGPLATHELDKLTLHLYSVNGKHLSRESLETAIADMVISADHLVLGSVNGHLIIKQLYGLHLLSTVQLHQAVTCVAVANEGSRILCALADSSLIVVAVKRL